MNPAYRWKIWNELRANMPGILLITVIGAAAFALHRLPVLSVLSTLIFAIVIGIVVRNTIGLPTGCQAGVNFGLKRVLRWAVALLGLQLSIAQIQSVGCVGFLIVAATLISTFLFTIWLGKRMGIDEKLTRLIAAGTSICGASAVLAVNAVTDGTDEDVAYSVGTVTMFGTASMFLYPAIVHTLHLTPSAFGLWCGASIHEVAQVVAASFQDGKLSGQIGTISKLSRVMLLAPTVLLLGLVEQKKHAGGHFDLRRVTVPWFAFGFAALVCVNGVGLLPSSWKPDTTLIDQFLLAVSLAAMGLETHFEKLSKMGMKPLLLGATAWLFITVVSLTMVGLMD